MAKEKKKPFYKRWWFILLVIIIGIGAINSSGDNESSDTNEEDIVSTEESTQGEGEIESETEEDEVIEVGIGTAATIADVSFTVNGVEETKEIESGNQFIDNAVTEGKFVLVNITIENNKSESITINSSFFKIITEDGIEYDPNTSGEVMMAMSDDDFFLEQINPGLSKSGTVAFEVGEDLDLNTTVLSCQTGFWGTEKVEISLAE